MHLRGFTPSPGPDRLARFDKMTGVIDHPSVARSAVLNDYHTLPAETGRAPAELEDTFAKLEAIVAPWIRQLRSIEQPGRIPIDRAARDGLAGYLAMLHIRSPAFREPNQKVSSFLESIRIDTLLASSERYAMRMRADGDTRTDGELEAERIVELERFRSGEIYVEAPGLWSLGALKLALDEIRPILVEMHWMILRRSSMPFLVLGDQAVALLGPRGELGEIGFANDGVEVLVPLAASALLVMTREPHLGGIDVIAPDRNGALGLGPRWWQQANGAAWRTAARFLFARSDADLHGTELSLDPTERRATLPGPSYRGGDPAWAAYAERIGIEVIADGDL